MYTLRAHTKPNQTNHTMEQMAIDFVLNNSDYRRASSEPDYPARLPCQHAPLHNPSTTSQRSQPSQRPLTPLHTVPSNCPFPENPRPSKCKRPPLGVSPQRYRSLSGTTAQLGAALGNVIMGGRLDCSLYKQFILILFLVFRFILIYLSFFTEFYFLFTIQSLFFLDTEFVLFFICSDLIDFIFIFTTFHLSNSTPRAFIAPNVALKTTTGPSRTAQRPLDSTGEPL